MDLSLQSSVMVTACPITQSEACMNINKCLEQVYFAQLGFHTAVENEFLWSLVRKQCSSKTNKNLKPNETKKMFFPPK